MLPFWRVVTQDTAEMVSAAHDLLPVRISELVGATPVWEGDVTFGGLWLPAWGNDDGSARCWWERDGRSVLSGITLPFRPHAWWPNVGTVLHELGHALYNRLIRPHDRERVFWSVGDREVVVRTNSGIVPSLRQLVSLEKWEKTGNTFDAFGEQFAEAFRIWLSPPTVLYARWEPGQFYLPAGSLDHWGERSDNRRLLAWFNRLAGLEWDLPPRALRSGP